MQNPLEICAVKYAWTGPIKIYKVYVFTYKMYRRVDSCWVVYIQKGGHYKNIQEELGEQPGNSIFI